jgi:hypothetical protein
MKEPKKITEFIAERLRRFAKIKFSTIKGLADAMKMSDVALRTNYLSGRSIPGGKVLMLLDGLGCDIKWLLTGIGVGPDMDEQEMQNYLEFLEKETTFIKLRLDTYREVKRQFEEKKKKEGVSEQ